MTRVLRRFRRVLRHRRDTSYAVAAFLAASARTVANLP
jgi:hypothetical protein